MHEKQSTAVKNDWNIIACYLFPELRRYAWPIIGSLSLTAIIIAADILQPYCFKLLIDAATLQHQYQFVVSLLLALLALAVIRSLLSYGEIYARTHVGEGISARYREKLFEHTLHLPFETLHDIDSGVLVNRIMNECGMIGRVYVSTQLLPIIATIFQSLALILLLLLLDWQIGLASIAIFPLGWIIAQKITQRSRAHDTELRFKVEQGQSFLQEVISGIREVRAVAHEAKEIRRWKHWLQGYKEVISKTTAEHEFVRITVNRLINWIGLCIVYGYGGWQLLHQSITIGTLLACGLYIQQLYTALATIFAGRVETGRAANTLQSLQDLLVKPREWPEQGTHDLRDIQGHLTFKDVSFQYRESAASIQQISFHIAPGHVLGIVGPSGSGKSTLIDLCMRFYEPTQGHICLDDHDISQVAAHQVRHHIGLVSQDIMLWDASIRENLMYGMTREMPWDDILEICRKVHVHDFVQALPRGYDTVVGARGVKLSGGEKQRIALARVLLRDPKIILLDEATAALDSLTEAAITRTLMEDFHTKTRILVAHRLATVHSADQVLVMQNGRIVEAGSPHLLCQQNGLYAQLYQTQRLEVLGAKNGD